MFSASQVTNYRGCIRKWGFKSVEKVPDPGTKFSWKGNAVHKVAEDFLKHGKAPDASTEEGKIFLPGLKHLPAPGTCATVEELFKWYPANEPFGFMGKMDWVEQHNEARKIVLGDHKTTGDMKYAHDEASLALDVQNNLYQGLLMELEPDPEWTFWSRWVYYLTTARKGTRKIEIQVHRPLVAEVVETIFEDCREMASRRIRQERAAEMPYNVAHCDAFGGCPYRGTVCGVSPLERFRSTMATMSLKEKMAARAAQAAAVNPPEQVAPAAVAAPAKAPVLVQAAAPAAVTAPVQSAAAKMKARVAKAAPAVVVAEAQLHVADVVVSPVNLTGTKSNTPSDAEVDNACYKIAEGLATLIKSLRK
jgi:hypothetical protein